MAFILNLLTLIFLTFALVQSKHSGDEDDANFDFVASSHHYRVAAVSFKPGGIYRGPSFYNCLVNPKPSLADNDTLVIPHRTWASDIVSHNCLWLFEVISITFSPDLVILPTQWSVNDWIEANGSWHLDDPKIDYVFDKYATEILCEYDVIIGVTPTHLPECPPRIIWRAYTKATISNWQYRLYMPFEPVISWFNFDFEKWGKWCNMMIWNYGDSAWERSKEIFPNSRLNGKSIFNLHYVYNLRDLYKSERDNLPNYAPDDAKVILLRQREELDSKMPRFSHIKDVLAKHQIPFVSRNESIWNQFTCSDLRRSIAVVDTTSFMSALQFAVDAALCKTLSIASKYRFFQTAIHHPDLIAETDEEAIAIINRVRHNLTLREHYINYALERVHIANLTHHQASMHEILASAKKQCPVSIVRESF